jgi:hypothetical protein
MRIVTLPLPQFGVVLVGLGALTTVQPYGHRAAFAIWIDG